MAKGLFLGYSLHATPFEVRPRQVQKLYEKLADFDVDKQPRLKGQTMLFPCGVSLLQEVPQNSIQQRPR